MRSSPLTLLGRVLLVSRSLRARARLLLILVRLERGQYPGALHPSMWRRGFLSARYYAYPAIQDPAVPYVSDVMVEARLSNLNGATGKRMLEDKNVFADALTARGLGNMAPEVYGTITSGSFRPRSAAAAARMRAQETVVVKPVVGSGGRGVHIVPGLAIPELDAVSHGESLLQERVTQHPVLAAVHPGSLNTVRLLAIRLPEDGPVLAAAVHRWGTAASGPVDNVSAGGLSSAVDVRTGRLGPAVGRPRHRRRVEFDEHPDTGTRITGVLVPYWAEACDLVLRLMQAFPEVDHVGWDLCVTGAGPVVLEGNATVPNLNVFQFHGPFLNDPRVRRYYVRHGLLGARHD